MFMRCLFWFAVLALAVGSAFVTGCAPRAECFAPISFRPDLGLAIVFDQCSGDFSLRALPPVPKPPDAAIVKPEHPKTPRESSI